MNPRLIERNNMVTAASAKKIEINNDENYRPYFRAGVNYAPESLIRGILSDKLPKAYEGFSEEKIRHLRVQAALSEQGLGHLLVGDKKPSHAYGLDGIYGKNSNEA